MKKNEAVKDYQAIKCEREDEEREDEESVGEERKNKASNNNGRVVRRFRQTAHTLPAQLKWVSEHQFETALMKVQRKTARGLRTLLRLSCGLLVKSEPSDYLVAEPA
ncbi:hypothetical protein BDV93DRAFT_511374 [Ceratobasidium sp. AG-I]|nr:hypothetical protein BDV93DRAFT_511374 [Ceratobasidium sp. AG-I]